MSEAAWVNAGVSDSAIGNASITAATDTLGLTAHGLADGDLVAFQSQIGGTELVSTAVYFVRNAAADTFQLSATRGGNLIEFAADGTVDVFTATPQYTAVELRRLDSALMMNGSAQGLGGRQGVRPGPDVVTLSGTTWTVQNHSGVIYPAIQATSGPYRYSKLEESGATQAADGTNDRIDALDLQVQDDAEDSSGFRRLRPIVYAIGTPGSGSSPAVTANSIRLAEILVPSGGTPGPSLTSYRPLFTVANGSVLPCRDATELPTQGLYSGLLVYQQDTNKLRVWNGSSWDTLPRVTDTHARYIAVNPQTIANTGWQKIRTGTIVDECSHVTKLAGEDYRIETSGIYAIEGGARFASSSTGSRHHVISDEVSDAARYTGQSMNGASAGTHSISSGVVRPFAAGDLVAQYLWQNSGAGLATDPTGEIVHLSFTLLAES